jgi:cytidylate kinase
MVEQQRALGASGGIVMEGRDIGTAVFPDAEVKIFLDASPEVRGDRRYRQVAKSNAVQEAGSPEQKAAQQVIVRELKQRDERDRNRAESPLKPAADAIILDSTAMTLEQVLARAEEVVRSHIPCQTTGDFPGK